jgi:hypothetical protein
LATQQYDHAALRAARARFANALVAGQIACRGGVPERIEIYKTIMSIFLVENILSA